MPCGSSAGLRSDARVSQSGQIATHSRSSASRTIIMRAPRRMQHVHTYERSTAVGSSIMASELPGTPARTVKLREFVHEDGCWSRSGQTVVACAAVAGEGVGVTADGPLPSPARVDPSPARHRTGLRRPPWRPAHRPRWSALRGAGRSAGRGAIQGGGGAGHSRGDDDDPPRPATRRSGGRRAAPRTGPGPAATGSGCDDQRLISDHVVPGTGIGGRRSRCAAVVPGPRSTAAPLAGGSSRPVGDTCGGGHQLDPTGTASTGAIQRPGDSPGSATTTVCADGGQASAGGPGARGTNWRRSECCPASGCSSSGSVSG